MYQLMLRLEATRDCAWERQYHRRIRGRLSQALQQAGIDGFRGSDRPPFVFSDFYPVADGQHPGMDLSAGDDVHLLVATSRQDVLEAIAGSLQTTPEVTAGSMVFEARAAKPIETGVGPVGTSGTLTTASGVVLGVADDRRQTDTEYVEYWTDNKHSVDDFEASLERHAGQLLRKETGGATYNGALFDDYDLIKSYSTRLRVTPEQTVTLIASKWDLDYQVRDEQHREALNALLGLGVGRRRSFGFGMLQTRDGLSEVA